MGSNRNHEEIISIDRKLDGSVNQIREELGAQIQEQLQGFMVMFTQQRSINLSPDFPPREGADFILLAHGMSQRRPRTSEVGDELGETGENVVGRRQGMNAGLGYPGYPSQNWISLCLMGVHLGGGLDGVRGPLNGLGYRCIRR